MVLQCLTLLLFACSAISAQEVDYGISAYCEKSKSLDYYPPTPIECCGKQYRCENFIRPGGRGFGLRNFNAWTMRECQCDVRMQQCLRAGLTDPEHLVTATHLMNTELCFYLKSEFCLDQHTCTRAYGYASLGVYMAKL